MDAIDKLNFKISAAGRDAITTVVGSERHTPSSDAYRYDPKQLMNGSRVLKYGPEDTAKLDAVLESVNQLIECLNVEFDDDGSESDEPVSMTTQFKAQIDYYVTGVGKIKEGPTERSAASSNRNVKAGDLYRNKEEIGDLLNARKENALFSVDSKQGLAKNESTTIGTSFTKAHREPKTKPTANRNITNDKLMRTHRLNGSHSDEEIICSVDSNTFNDRNLFQNNEIAGRSPTQTTKDEEDTIKLNSSTQENDIANRSTCKRCSLKEGNSPASLRRGAQSFDETGFYQAKQKHKLHNTLSLPIKVSAIENQVLKVILNKRKTSRSSKDTDERDLPLNSSSNCSCFDVISDRKTSSAFTMPQSPSTTKKASKKSEKSGSTRRKTFASKPKRLGSYFKRAQSFEERGRNFLDSIGQFGKETSHDPEQNQKGKSSKKSRKTSLNISPITEPPGGTVKDERIDETVQEVFRLISSPHMKHKGQQEGCSSLKMARRAKASEDSSAKLLRIKSVSSFKRHDDESASHTEKRKTNRKISGQSQCGNDIFLDKDVKVRRRRRATMDSGEIRPNFDKSDDHLNTDWLKTKHDVNDDQASDYSSWPRNATRVLSRQRNTNKAIYSLAQANRVAEDSDNSTRGSQDSLDEAEHSRSNFSTLRFLRGDKQEDYQDSDKRELSKKGKKNRLRKSLKSVGKTPSMPVHDADEMAERTWRPDGDYTWSNMSGRKVELGSTRLQSLSELECDALQRVSLQRLHNSDLGVSVSVPKDESKILNRKMSIKKKYGVTLLLKDRSKDKDTRCSDHVFGIPLVKAVENDQLLRLQKSASFATTLDFSSPTDATPSQETPLGIGATNALSSASSKSSSCSGSTSSINNTQPSQSINRQEVEKLRHRPSLIRSSSVESLTDQIAPVASDGVEGFFHRGLPSESTPPIAIVASGQATNSTASRPLKRRGAIAADSINEIDPYQSQLLEALSLSVSGATHSQRREKKRSLLPPTMAQVPYVVEKCCDHITKYGLAVTGIFRIAGSRKRVRQLREEFDRGVDVTIDEDYNPHDVAALLKEFFRDLPEALLTRDLYPAFIQTTKLPKEERLAALRSLVWLLPLTNRDTLHTLLNFLALVASHSETTTDEAGNKAPGNKMNIVNLATIFGPNILHRHKKSNQSSNDNHYQVQSLEKAEDSTSVIKVTEDIITNHLQLFQIPKAEHDQMLRVIKETDPEAVDFLLRRKAANHMREKSKKKSSRSISPKSARNRERKVRSEVFTVVPSEEDQLSLMTSSKTNGDVNLMDISTLCMDYQDVICHPLMPMQEEESDEAVKLHFQRPVFKDPSQHTDSSDMDERYESTASSGPEENSIGPAPNIALGFVNKDEVMTLSQPDDEIITPSVSDKKPDHVTSFTEDELEEVFGSNTDDSDRTISSKLSLHNDLSIRRNDEEEERHSDVNIDACATNYDVIPELSDLCLRDLAYNESIQVTNSSDSGVSVDYTKNLDNSSPDCIKSHGGFNLFQPLSTSVTSGDETSSQTTENTVIDVSAVSYNDVSPGRVVAYVESNDVTSDHSDDCTASNDRAVVEVERVIFTRDQLKNPMHGSKIEKFVSHVNVNVKRNDSKNDTNDHNNNNNNQKYTKRRTTQIVRLCTETVTQTDNTLQQTQSIRPSHSDQEKKSRDRNISDKQSPVTEAFSQSLNGPTTYGLSSRFHRQYAGASSVPIQFNHVDVSNSANGGSGRKSQNFNLPLDNLLYRGDNYFNDTFLGRRHRHDVFVRKTSGNIKPTSSRAPLLSHRSTEAYCDIASHKRFNKDVSCGSRRPSKDDVTVTNESKRSPSGSRWTCGGVLTPAASTCDLSTNVRQNLTRNSRSTFQKGSVQTTLWKHCSLQDSHQLPETLV